MGTLLVQTATANMLSLDQLCSQIVLPRQCHVTNLELLQALYLLLAVLLLYYFSPLALYKSFVGEIGLFQPSRYYSAYRKQ